MSRIGKLPIPLSKDVKVSIENYLQKLVFDITAAFHSISHAVHDRSVEKGAE